MKEENNNENFKGHEIGEDATQYGEFISSYFAWIPLSVQKEKAEKFENMANGSDTTNEKTKKYKEKEE